MTSVSTHFETLNFHDFFFVFDMRGTKIINFVIISSLIGKLRSTIAPENIVLKYGIETAKWNEATGCSSDNHQSIYYCSLDLVDPRIKNLKCTNKNVLLLVHQYYKRDEDILRRNMQ